MAELFLEKKIEYWQNQMLNINESNVMLDYDESKNTTLKLLVPSMTELFDRIVLQKNELKFQCFIDKKNDFETYALLKLMESLSYPLQEEDGEIEANGTFAEVQKTLDFMYKKSQLSWKEYGIHSLHMVIGFLQWYEEKELIQWKKSPLILVPVTLSADSTKSSFSMKLHEKNIEINPTLVYLLEKNYGINLPEFDIEKQSVSQYLETIAKKAEHNGWSIILETSLCLNSILDIEMYKDLEKNKETIVENTIIRSFAGLDRVFFGNAQLNNLNQKQSSEQLYQVLSADFCQQQAMKLAREGVSFVLQGAPGTGKSQTIINIIAQGLADGKKILFVSPKMIALEVVRKRLEKLHLSDFCISSFYYGKEKEKFLEELRHVLQLKSTPELQEDTVLADELNILEKELNQYHQELNTIIMPFQMSIYQVFGLLSQWDEYTSIPYSFSHIENITKNQFDFWCKLVEQLENAWGSLNYPSACAWAKTNITTVTEELQKEILSKFSDIYYWLRELNQIRKVSLNTNLEVEFGLPLTLRNMSKFTVAFKDLLALQQIPVNWCFKMDLEELENETKLLQRQIVRYNSLKRELSKEYEKDIFTLDAVQTTIFLKKGKESLLPLLKNYQSDSDIIEDLPVLCNRAEELGYTIKNLKHDISYLKHEIGFDIGDKISVMSQYYQLVAVLLADPCITRQWFIQENIETLEGLLEEIRIQSISYFENRDLLSQMFTNQFFSLEGTIWRNYLSQYSTIAQQLCDFSGMTYAEKLVPSDFETIVQDLENKVTLVDDLWDEAQNYVRKCKRYFPIPKLEKKESIQEHMTIIHILLTNIAPPASWSEDENRNKAKKIIAEAKVHSTRVQPLISSVRARFEEEVFELPYYDMLERFQNNYNNSKKVLQKMYHQDKKEIKAVCKAESKKMTDADIILLFETLIKIEKERNWFKSKEKEMLEFLGNYYEQENTNWKAVEMAIPQFEQLTQFLGSKKKVFMALKQANPQTKDLLEHYSAVLKELNEKIVYFDVVNKGEPLSELLQEWKEVASIGSEFCDGLIEVAKYKKEEIPYELSYSEIIENCCYLEQMQECEAWLDKHKYLLKEMLPISYIGFETDWEKVEQDITAIKKLKQLCPDQKVPKQMIDTLPYINAQMMKENIQITNYRKISKWLREEVKDFLAYDITEGDSIENLDEILSQISYGCIQIQNSYYTMEEKAKQLYSVDKILNDIRKLDTMQQLRSELESKEEENNLKYGKFYNSFETDWAVLFQKIKSAESLQEKIKQLQFQEQFVERCLNIKTYKLDLPLLILKLEEIETRQDDIKWICSLFENSEQIKSMSVYQFHSHILQCVNEISTLGNWVNYNICKKNCLDVRLDSVVSILESEKVPKNHLLTAFQKTFYQQWVQWAEKQHSSISEFDSKEETEKIQHFRYLDTKQILNAPKYIREKINQRLLQEIHSDAFSKELAVVLTEWRETNQIPSFKEILKKIPNVLLAWKPCLMMSPVSVASYLDTKKYHFDMVIFDEASQIFPQYAISSIIRGNQVVIVGDRKQLPPKNFFLNHINDVETDEKEMIVYNSILEEAMGSMPSEQLLWHYRSKNEDLIAFSNQEFYKNSLITFPNCTYSKGDLGVEYCYVKGGVYENHCNRKEAEKCIELIQEHIHKYPKRSMGIITFSENQQSAIEKEIKKFRNRNPQYEWFFEENSAEPFFIKTIDDVQGEERDTILFSICFGKNANGNMAKKFDILESKGGERFLNIAITRAKFNLKLIGSIFPSDIAFDKMNSEGVRLLRSYIIFAISSKKTTVKGTAADEDDVFCQCVAQYIADLGYQVHRNVGCSENLIDIAIEYPNHSDSYLIGIECDGSSCSVAKNIRDRERIRPNILKQMGWDIYRLWSVEWVKHPKREKEKLAAYIKNCITDYEKNLVNKKNTDKKTE